MPQVDGVRHRFQAAGGLNFHVAEAGEGEPLLLLHGWPQHWYCWRLVIPELAKHYRVLAMDLRGFGWTDIAWEGLDKETMADDVANVMSALEIDRARIVGHDWGGWIGYLLALRRPELVERLVALSSPPPFAKPSLRGVWNVAPARLPGADRLAARPAPDAPPELRRQEGPPLVAQPRARPQRRPAPLRPRPARVHPRACREPALPRIPPARDRTRARGPLPQAAAHHPDTCSCTESATQCSRPCSSKDMSNTPTT